MLVAVGFAVASGVAVKGSVVGSTVFVLPSGDWLGGTGVTDVSAALLLPQQLRHDASRKAAVNNSFFLIIFPFIILFIIIIV